MRLSPVFELSDVRPGALLRPLINHISLILILTLFRNTEASSQVAVKGHQAKKSIHQAAKESQLTFDTAGHLLNSTQCFSKDDQWIVYDGRNLDTPIPANGKIEMVNTSTRAIKLLYQTSHQTEFGPGVGAATFSPTQDRVLFIQGLRDSDKDKPYSFSRRTGVSVLVARPGVPEYLDARDIVAPYTPGALRGGTHAHTWSADGNWISCTYNDFVIEQLARKDTTLKDIRVVAVFNNSKSVQVPDTDNPENNNGKMFAAVVTRVTDHPARGTDEIDKAFDECWIGNNGYVKKDGNRQKRAIAFQGNVKDEQGGTKTEVFVVDIPDELRAVDADHPLEGKPGLRPSVPFGLKQRRITFTEKGLQGPRFWLRTTEDGHWIGYLAADAAGIIQFFIVSPNGGEPRQITHLEYSIEGPFNISPDGNQVAFIADGSVFICRIWDDILERMTKKSGDNNLPVGAVVWSNSGKMLAYNRYLKTKSGSRYLQIFLLKLAR